MPLWPRPGTLIGKDSQSADVCQIISTYGFAHYNGDRALIKQVMTYIFYCFGNIFIDSPAHACLEKVVKLITAVHKIS